MGRSKFPTEFKYFFVFSKVKSNRTGGSQAKMLKSSAETRLSRRVQTSPYPHGARIDPETRINLDGLGIMMKKGGFRGKEFWLLDNLGIKWEIT